MWNEEIVKTSFLFIAWTKYLWESYLLYRQYRITCSTVDVPGELKGIMSNETFSKTRLYALATYKYQFVKDTFAIIVSSIVIQFGILALVWNAAIIPSYIHNDSEILTSCIWLFLLITLTTMVDLPLSIYKTFVLEENFGFNKQTASFFVSDNIKYFILYQFLAMIISPFIIVTVNNSGEYFFIWLWLVVSVLLIILILIYPSLIAPLFDKYSPLPDGELKQRIENLATQLEFPLSKLYIVEGSKRSCHSNAYFFGFFKTKNIVVFDTLLARSNGSGCSNDEIIAVLSHELGHWKHNHFSKFWVLEEVYILVLCISFSYTFKYLPVCKAMGFMESTPVLVGLVIVTQYVMVPFDTIFNFLITCLSRRFEFQADNFALQLGNQRNLIRALIQLYKDNLAFPIYDHLFSAWYHSHPPLLERIAALKAGGTDKIE